MNYFLQPIIKAFIEKKKLKLKKHLKEIPISPPEIAHTNNTWIENLDLTADDKEVILSNQDLHDRILGAAINLIQRQFPILVIQSPSLYFASDFEYFPSEKIQIIHNNAHHWILISSFNGEVRIFDSLNTDPTIETLQQIKQLFSPENTFPQYQLSPCHKQVGTTDCGDFGIAYSIDILFGNNPSEIVFDQSKLRQHLVDCFGEGTLTTFPKYKCNVKYDDTNTSGPISSEDQHKGLIPRCSARLKKRLENITPIEIINKCS